MRSVERDVQDGCLVDDGVDEVGVVFGWDVSGSRSNSIEHAALVNKAFLFLLSAVLGRGHTTFIQAYTLAPLIGCIRCHCVLLPWDAGWLMSVP